MVEQRYKVYEQALREILRRSGMTAQDEVSAERMLDSLIAVLRPEKPKPTPRPLRDGKRKGVVKHGTTKTI